MTSKRISALTIILALLVSLTPGGLATEVGLDSATLQNKNTETKGGADAIGEGASGRGKWSLGLVSNKFVVGFVKDSGVLDNLPLGSLGFGVVPITSLEGVEKVGEPNEQSEPNEPTDPMEMSLAGFQKKQPKLYGSLLSIVKSFAEQQDEIQGFVAINNDDLGRYLVSAHLAFGAMTGAGGEFVSPSHIEMDATLRVTCERLELLKLLFDRMREKAGSEEFAALATAIDTLLNEIHAEYGDWRRSQIAVQQQSQTGGSHNDTGSGLVIPPMRSLDTGGFVDNYIAREPEVPDKDDPHGPDNPDISDDPDTSDNPGDDTPQ